MSVKFYNDLGEGKLKFVEEVEGTDDVDVAREALFEARPRLASNDEFVCIVGDYENGVVTTLRKQETVTTVWGTANGATAEPAAEAPKAAPKRTQRKAASKPKSTGKAASRKATAKTGSKPKATTKSASKPKAAPKPASGKASPFTRNAASDE